MDDPQAVRDLAAFKDKRTGQFVKGNPGSGMGGGRSKRQDKYQALADALVNAVGTSDMEEVIGALIEQAKGGDVQAARLVLDYCVTKPTQELDITIKRSPLEDLSDEALEALRRAKELEHG